VLNIHSYFHRIQSGLGLTATHDKTGVGSQMINAKLAYAYHVNLGEKWLLSLGLSGGIIQQSYDPSKHYVIDPNDDAYLGEKISQLNPDADFGFELTSRRFQLGASVTHLIRMPDKQTTFKLGQQYHAYASYKQPIGESFELILGARGMNIDTQPYLDAHLIAVIGKVFWIGGAYRPVNLDDFSPNTVAGMIGVQLGFARVGYAYDHSIGKIGSIAQNSHEVMVSLKIGKPKKTINTKSPRFIEE
jgi:type IX secretion system PorP/SprF family membrane protein